MSPGRPADGIARREDPGRRLPVARPILAGLILLAACLSSAIAADVRIREWALPTRGSFPHDPAAGNDGALWYTGMSANLIGRLDPATGAVREYPLKTPASGPHGLVVARDGNVWYTANHIGAIGRLDPRTGQVTEFPMPEPSARDPHTPIFDRSGILWFTVQAGNFVGKLDPRTGKIVLARPPTADSRPYGIVIDAKGVPFFCEFGTNRIGRIDPATMRIAEYVLPEGARPRRLAAGSDGRIYYTDHRRGFLGRLDPESGKVEEWPSPGGSDSKPYGIAATGDGSVWYSESGVSPNTIVRFDPKRANFARWDVPSGGGTIRHMVATPGGKVYLACSGVNRVGIVEPGGEPWR